VSFTKTLVRSESASGEHFGAITEQFIYRVIYDNPSQTPSTRQVLNDLISQSGFAGINARPGRPLAVDATTIDMDLIVRSIDCTLGDQGGLDVVISCTRYDWKTVSDSPVRIMIQPQIQTVAAFRMNPVVPDFSSLQPQQIPVAEVSDEAWAGVFAGAFDSTFGLLGGSGSEPTAEAPEGTGNPYRPEGDIGGTPVDSNGTPMQLALPVVRIEIEVFRRGGYTKPDNTYEVDEMRPLQGSSHGDPVSQMIGKRNAAPFLGYEIGSVLFDSFDRQRLDGEQTIARCGFLWHPWRHAVQIPRQTWGTNFGAQSYEGDPRQIMHMRGVYWKQPYMQTLVDFNSLGDPTGTTVLCTNSPAGEGIFTCEELRQMYGFSGLSIP
tara:strand:+ start:662 stop:1795 length:1134 start_codon:yes stop_codon:yes gene_type:complete